MHERKCAFVAFLVLLFETSCVKASAAEDSCIDYYGSGENFDLSTLQGDRYAVYFWPPNQRSRDDCAVIHFEKLSRQDVEANSALNVLSNETVMEAKYINSVGKQVKLLYFGDTEVKSQYRYGKPVSKYILRKVNDEYVLGINCSSGGRAMLLSKRLPTASQVQAVVDSIEVMADTDGSPDCRLP